MTDIYWDRIEPHSRDVDLEEGLQARIADPLFTLARQWQVGEFRGEDAASPVKVRIELEERTVSHFQNLAREGAPLEPLPVGRPLESLVEAEGLGDGLAAFALSAELGLQLLRRVDAAGLPSLRSYLRSDYALTAPESALALPRAERRRVELRARGSVDGLRLLRVSDEVLAAAVAAADRARVNQLVAAWKREAEARFDLPSASGETWRGSRFEHSFRLGVRTGDATLSLNASEYPGGRLDWHAFDVESHPAAAGATRPARRTLELVPVPLAYKGMPASRFWELEEGEVYFGGIEASPADVGRMLVAEYATVYSNDFFLLPIRLQVGSLARIVRLEVVNTFGERERVRSFAERDAASLPAGQERPFALFELTGDPSASEGHAPWLFVPPALALTQASTPLEKVSFVRDEVANLAWAIEETIEGPSGRPLPRRLLWEPEPETAGAAPPDALWRYRLQSAVPPHWIPFIPERVSDDSPDIRLRRARLLAWEELPEPGIAGPKGRLLQPERPLRIFEEEIPRGGIEVTRHWQVTRGEDGSLRLWRARRKRQGRGERGSGLRFDRIVRPED